MCAYVCVCARVPEHVFEGRQGHECERAQAVLPHVGACVCVMQGAHMGFEEAAWAACIHCKRQHNACRVRVACCYWACASAACVVNLPTSVLTRFSATNSSSPNGHACSHPHTRMACSACRALVVSCCCNHHACCCMRAHVCASCKRTWCECDAHMSSAPHLQGLDGLLLPGVQRHHLPEGCDLRGDTCVRSRAQTSMHTQGGKGATPPDAPHLHARLSMQACVHAHALLYALVVAGGEMQARRGARRNKSQHPCVCVCGHAGTHTHTHAHPTNKHIGGHAHHPAWPCAPQPPLAAPCCCCCVWRASQGTWGSVAPACRLALHCQ